MGRFKWLFISAFVFCVAIAFFFMQSIKPLEVEVASVEHNTEVRIAGIGTVEAQVVSRIGFQISGRIVSLTADQGDAVNSGALIATLDDSAQRAKLAKTSVNKAQSEAAHAKALAVLRKAEVGLQQKTTINRRRQSLVAREFVSQEAADDARSSEALARADVEIAKADLQLADAGLKDAAAVQAIEQVTLDQHKLIAPFTGRVLSRGKEMGAVANPGETIFTLVEPSSIWVRAFIDEALAGGIELGQTAFVRLRSERHRSVEAKVVRIDQENDRITEERRIYVRCVDCEPEHQARIIGEQAEVEVIKKNLPEAIFLPLKAVEKFNGDKGIIWVIENGTLNQRSIALGDRLLDGRIALAEKLPEGVKAVTSQSNQRFVVVRAAVIVGGRKP